MDYREQLDTVLRYLRDTDKPVMRGKMLTDMALIPTYRLDFRNSPDHFNRLINKLVFDKFLEVNMDMFYITLDGYYFNGYVETYAIENDLACRKNIRDFVLTYGTALAGLAGLGLLIYSIWSYIFPVCK